MFAIKQLCYDAIASSYTSPLTIEFTKLALNKRVSCFLFSGIFNVPKTALSDYKVIMLTAVRKVIKKEVPEPVNRRHQLTLIMEMELLKQTLSCKLQGTNYHSSLQAEHLLLRIIYHLEWMLSIKKKKQVIEKQPSSIQMPCQHARNVPSTKSSSMIIYHKRMCLSIK